MADINIAYKLLMQREFSNNKDLFVHQNSGEGYLTIAGLYRKYNQDAIEWEFVDRVIAMCSGDLKRASRLLILDQKIQSQIFHAFKSKYWDKYRLSEIIYQDIANEIFISATNIGGTNTAKMVQKFIGVEVDGIIGGKTLKALNSCNPKVFDTEFDKIEIANYERIVRNNPRLSHNLKGLINRAVAV